MSFLLLFLKLFGTYILCKLSICLFKLVKDFYIVQHNNESHHFTSFHRPGSRYWRLPHWWTHCTFHRNNTMRWPTIKGHTTGASASWRRRTTGCWSIWRNSAPARRAVSNVAVICRCAATLIYARLRANWMAIGARTLWTFARASGARAWTAVWSTLSTPFTASNYRRAPLGWEWSPPKATGRSRGCVRRRFRTFSWRWCYRHMVVVVPNPRWWIGSVGICCTEQAGWIDWIQHKHCHMRC